MADTEEAGHWSVVRSAASHRHQVEGATHQQYLSFSVCSMQSHCTVGDAFTEHVVVGKIFVAKKYLVTPSVFKLQKWFLHQNGVEFNKKSKSDLTKLWPLVGR